MMTLIGTWMVMRVNYGVDVDEEVFVIDYYARETFHVVVSRSSQVDRLESAGALLGESRPVDCVPHISPLIEP